MFQRPRTSSPVPEPAPPADAGDAAGRRMQMLLERRDDAKRWGVPTRPGAPPTGAITIGLHLSFLEALTREERAAHQLERVISTPGTVGPIT